MNQTAATTPESQSASSSGVGINQDKVRIIQSIFGTLRFAFTRFGRLINLFDALTTLHKKKKFAITLPFGVQAPAIKRIQQQDSFFDAEKGTYKQKISSPLI